MGMSINKVGTPLDIAVTGLRAQAMRMNVIANNIANANTTRTETGEPYRRKEVALSTDSQSLSGVSIGGAAEDTRTECKEVYDPGNPDARSNGFVSMPNVELPVEMMHMVDASRAYQANAAVLKRYQDMNDATLDLIR
jgi:flagellar basal-body rod protein FlgC